MNIDISNEIATELILKYTNREPTEKELNDLKKTALELCPSLDSHPYRLAAIMSLLEGIGEQKFIVSKIPRYIRTGEISTAARAFLHWCFVKGRHVPEIECRRREEMEMFINDSDRKE